MGTIISTLSVPGGGFVPGTCQANPAQHVCVLRGTPCFQFHSNLKESVSAATPCNGDICRGSSILHLASCQRPASSGRARRNAPRVCLGSPVWVCCVLRAPIMGSSFGCRGDICRGASISDVASGWPAASRRARRRALYVRGTQPLPRKCTPHLRHRHCNRTYLGRSWVLEIFCFRGCPSLSSVSRWLLSGFEPAC